ncbi:unnamed protein product [Nyctereutes procyonoides]|uniref:(raccoon dog) hypothetical protein n=1 Tax=Nyctereutes procyonoides TaxID=34880 RepID=A0A811YM53_NYCPR|nr:unnamed protein product [Nyctereutes procyonoides]
MFARFIHVAFYSASFIFLWQSNIPLYGVPLGYSFNSLWAFGLFPFFAIINSAAKNIHVREREREAETQAEGEAGSMQGTRRGTRSRDSRIAPWAKGRRQTAEPPRDPPDLEN